MRLIIEARIETEGGEASREGGTIVAVIERRERSLSQLGLTLAEGRSLLAEVQALLASEQAAQWIVGETDCRHCGSPLSHKDSRSIVLRTVFGKVQLNSPRLWTCACRKAPRRTNSPLSKALPKRVTPELEYLQVKGAAHPPYRTATVLLKETLPLDKSISFSGARNRVRAVGKALDAQIERDIARQPKVEVVSEARECSKVTALSVDSAWLRHYDGVKSLGRHVNIVAGRATFAQGSPRLYAYAHKEAPSAAARLDQFLRRSGVAPDERVTVISDDAGEFSKAVQGSELARGRVLDGLHIAMKFKAAERAVFGGKTIEPLARESVESEIQSAKRLVWRGKGGEAVARIKALDESLMANEAYEFSTPWWNLRAVSGYIRNNAPTLVNYSARYRNGLPISSIAESAVNQVVSHRMAKKQQMRWTDSGAHCLAQVRVAALNGELTPSRLAKWGNANHATHPSPHRHRAEEQPHFSKQTGRVNDQKNATGLPRFCTLSTTTSASTGESFQR